MGTAANWSADGGSMEGISLDAVARAALRLARAGRCRHNGQLHATKATGT